MTVRYAWSDNLAPTLNGICGSLVNVLDAILLYGYGNFQPQGWSLLNNSLMVPVSGVSTPYQWTGTNTGGSATTLIDTASDFKAKGVIPGMSVFTSGYSSAVISAISTTTNPNDTLTFASGGPNYTSGGQTYYILSNRRAYKQPAGSNGMVLRVEDTGQGAAASGLDAYFYGFEKFTKFVTGKATGGSSTTLVDTTKNFVTEGVVVGNTVRQYVTGAGTGGQITNAVITSITTTTNTNDTINYTSGTNTPTFAADACYCIDVGINVFPTTALLSTDSFGLGGARWAKSHANDTGVTWWWCVGNGKIFHFMKDIWTSNQYWNGITFGDILSYKYGADPYCTILICDNTGSYPNNWYTMSQALATTLAGHYIARTAAGTGGAIRVAKSSDYIKTGGVAVVGSGGLTYPHGVDGSMVLAPLWIHESVAVGIRGILPGVWCPCHIGTSLSMGDTFGGVASLPGRTFEWIRLQSSGAVAIETSPTW